jgi:cytochrome c-type biogenesis protein
VIADVVTAFGLGLLCVATPCLLPLYPAFFAYVAATTNETPISAGATPSAWPVRLAGLAMLGGVLVAMIAVGLIVTLVAVPLGSLLVLLVPIADLVVIALGVALIAGRNPFIRVAGFRVVALTNPYARAFVYGFVLGPLAVPCAGAFLVALLAIGLNPVDEAARLLTFLAFGFGFGLPLVALSLLTGQVQPTITTAIAARHVVLERVGGAVLVVIGVLDLRESWGAFSL